MATYDLTSTIPSKIKTGDILNCPYSGSAKSITLPKGTYKLECWGAQGGTGINNQSSGSDNEGGKGGYSVGVLTLKNSVTFYLYTGGCGIIASSTGNKVSGGFNGGGDAPASGHNGSGGGSGGGASDIRIGQDSLYARVIVAGGGGGMGYPGETVKGDGGGISGIAGTGKTSSLALAEGGSQTSGGICSGSYGGQNGDSGTFGVGGNGGISGTAAAGGGGGAGWYGGAGGKSGSSNSCKPGGGGSGYVYTSSTASNYPSGCLLNSSYYLTNASTIAGNTAFTSPIGTNETGHSGNGYIRITVIKAGSGNTLVKTTSSTWKEQKQMFIKTTATAWKPIKSIWTKIDGTTWKQIL